MIIKEFFGLLGLKIDEGSWKKADEVLGTVTKSLELVDRAVSVVNSTFQAFVGGLAETASELNATSNIFGVSVERTQEWLYVMGRAGLETRDLDQAVVQLGQNMSSVASSGTGQAAEAFKVFGIKLKDSHGKLRATEDVLFDLADAMHKMADGSKKTGAFANLFGEDQAKLVPVLSQGADALRAQMKEARELGLVMGKDTVTQSIELSRQMKTLTMVGEAFERSLATDLLPTLLDISKGILLWWRANREVIKQNVSRVLSVVVGVLNVLGATLRFVIDNWKLFAVILGVIGLVVLPALIGQLAYTIAVFVALQYASITAALASARAWIVANAPLIGMVALITLVILVLEDLYGWFTGKDSLIGAIIDRWGDAWSDWLDKFTEIKQDDPWWLAAIKEATVLVRGLIDQLADLGDSAVDAARATSALLHGEKYGIAGTPYETRAQEKSRLMYESLGPYNPDDFVSVASAEESKKIGTYQGSPAQYIAQNALSGASTAGANAITNSTKTTNLNAQFNIDGSKSPEETAKATMDAMEDWWDEKMGTAKGAH